MRVQGDVALEFVVWLTESDEARHSAALASALPDAEFLLTAMDRARLRFHRSAVDVEPRMGPRWVGLVTGRVVLDEANAGATAKSKEPFRAYVVEPAGPPPALETCWFATDEAGHVACFDRDLLGAAPMKRCWGPRPAPALVAPDPAALAQSLRDHHATARTPARAFTFAADAVQLAHELRANAPQALSRRWALLFHGDTVVVSAGAGTTTPGDPVAPALLSWIHARGLCQGCARSSLRDPRLLGLFVYQHQGRARAVPYECVSEPFAPWTPDEAAGALGLQPDTLRRSVLPLRFAAKDRLQPIEYVPCTWSETVPWESEQGARHGADSLLRR